MKLAEQMKQVTEFKIRKTVKDYRSIITDEIQRIAEQHKYQFEFSFPSFFNQNDKADLFDFLKEEDFKVEFLDNYKVLLISWDV
jgi:cobalamin-dependent methionine synthase I